MTPAPKDDWQNTPVACRLIVMTLVAGALCLMAPLFKKDEPTVPPANNTEEPAEPDDDSDRQEREQEVTAG